MNKLTEIMTGIGRESRTLGTARPTTRTRSVGSRRPSPPRIWTHAGDSVVSPNSDLDSCWCAPHRTTTPTTERLRTPPRHTPPADARVSTRTGPTAVIIHRELLPRIMIPTQEHSPTITLRQARITWVPALQALYVSARVDPCADPRHRPSLPGASRPFRSRQRPDPDTGRI